MVESGFIAEGYFDHYNADDSELVAESQVIMRRNYLYHEEGTKRRYEFAYTPAIGFLGSPEPLLNNTELKISFNLCEASTSKGSEKPSVCVTGKAFIRSKVEYVDWLCCCW